MTPEPGIRAFRRLQLIVYAGYGLAAFGIVLLSLLAYYVSRSEIEAADKLVHAERILGELSEIEQLVLDAESTGRGYLITGEDPLRQSFAAILPRIDVQLAQLSTLLNEDPVQRARLAELDQLVSHRFAFLESLILVRQNEGLEAAVQIARQGRGRAGTNAIKTVIEQMTHSEREMLVHRKAARERSVHAAWASIGALGVVGLIALTWLYSQMLRSLRGRERAELRARRLAQSDALTGLANRRRLNLLMSQALASAQRHGDALAVLCLDLDGFKAVNDELGHDAGDALLRLAAQRITGSLRSEDFAARTGGDEFAVVLPRLERREAADAVAEKLLASLSEPYHLAGRAVSVSASIGISHYPEDGDSTAGLLKAADVALYAAKRGGKARYCVHDARALPAGPAWHAG